MNLWQAIKSKITFPAYGGSGIQRGGIADWLTWTGSQPFDYVQSAGELHRNAVVMACVCWLMRAFPEAPVQVVREEARTGEENEVPQHPLTLALRRPNPFYGSDCLWQRVTFDRALHGQAYIFKERNERGEIIALWHIPQHRIIPQWPPSGKVFIDHYLFVLEQRQQVIPTSDLVHLRFGADPHNERNGLASLGSALREIAALNEGANYRGAILKNMGVPSHLVQAKDPTRQITGVQAEELHRIWAERVSGANRGKPIIPNFALEALKIGLSPAELDIGNMNYEAADAICAQFGLPAMVIGIASGNEQRTYANMREAKELATENRLVPDWHQVGQDLTLQLLPDYSTDQQEMVTFDLSRVRALQEDQNALWTRVVEALKAGAIQLNEGRALLGLPPVKGGDVFLTAPGEQTLDLSPETVLGALAASKPEAEGAAGNGNGRNGTPAGGLNQA